ncbi:MAG: pyridoxal phosphate-dependent aminotransferase [Candidatus Eutrophobiaceae bacterium]
MSSDILSRRVRGIKPSPTIAVSTKAAELKAQGMAIINLSTGEPDFDTPAHIKEAAIAAIRAGQTKYTAVDGTPELKQAIINKLERDNGLHYTAQEVSVACGAKHSIYNILNVLVDKDCEVIVPAPYWVSYPDMVMLAEGNVVVLQTGIENSYCITPEQLEAAITPKTRMLILNSPSNPSGRCYSRADLQALGETLDRHPNVWVMTDDIYEHILWDTQTGFCNILNACPQLRDRCLVVNGVSKSYAMTGWRIGYAAGPDFVIKAMSKVQSQCTTNPCSISQAAALAALNGDQSCLREGMLKFKARHDFVYDELSKIPGVECVPSQGTFYSFPNMSQIIEKLPGVDNDVELANFFLEKAKVAMVPGSAFGTPGHIRLSYATSMENLERAIEAINRVVTNALA